MCGASYTESYELDDEEGWYDTTVHVIFVPVITSPSLFHHTSVYTELVHTFMVYYVQHEVKSTVSKNG